MRILILLGFTATKGRMHQFSSLCELESIEFTATKGCMLKFSSLCELESIEFTATLSSHPCVHWNIENSVCEYLMPMHVQ